MGGTSTDVALIDGDIRLSNEAKIIGLPVAVPMVDMHTIGAGGGSIASIDEGGILQVGPESAGAQPGPASYNKGGNQATVTDANVVLGRLPSSCALADSLPLNLNAARNAIQPLAQRMACSIEEAALGIIRLANEHIAQALRVISVQKGIDPRGFSLMSFGGAGALQVCELAELMGMSRAIVPLNSGVFSAFGMLVSPISRELSITHVCDLDNLDTSDIDVQFQGLLNRGFAEMAQENVDPQQVVKRFSVDLRYVGQSFSLNEPWQPVNQLRDAFQQLHKQRYGHELDEAVELVTLRLSLKVETERLDLRSKSERAVAIINNKTMLYAVEQSADVINRNQIQIGDVIRGPALILEKVATTFVKPGWICEKEQHGHLLLKRENRV